MKVTILAKNIELTQALKDTVEKKISKLAKYFNPGVEAKVTLSVQKNKQRNRQIIEVTIPFNGVILRGEEATEDLYNSIDLVEEKIERQIRRQRTKIARRNHSGLDSLRYASIEALPEEEEEEFKVVKTKRFSVKPMSAEEAILQMELLGHNFFVYMDGETNDMNVVYKRKDGQYGLIEAEV
ncbi:MAG: ribosome-associated translation inhibitor RaiA [Clostridiaceae bacterium]